MNSTFYKAIDLVFRHEGLISDNPHDPGGLTKFGISKRAFPDLDIANLTREQAMQIYHSEYWMRVGADRFQPPIAIALFDTAVNMGTETAIRILQRTLGVKSDGILGNKTIAASISQQKDLVARFTAERCIAYQGIRNFDQFGRGWLKRSIITAVECSK
ncbi:zliS Lysozyme family protein [uncultured Caudovirales phage]|uniref:ZliS Lysozyme family protein n=1 Tax=uncultured Caudovirales phage TaxID=2100421 RepID=A0A6J5N5C0_9CAUD|nr:zliS Lysozyme family protein [uncultured Caudovirales phage]